MKQKGFALISLLMAVAIILIIIFGQGYFKNTTLDYKNEKEKGQKAIEKAEMLTQKIECKNKCLYINERQWQYAKGKNFETIEQCIDYCLNDK